MTFREDTGCVKRHVRAEGENDDGEEAREQGADASENASWTMRFVHRCSFRFSRPGGARVHGESEPAASSRHLIGED
jgi:hypothetical protein